MRKLVLDTNIVLDLFVFRDARSGALHDAITRCEVEWLATAAMREELACVLAYEQIAARMKAAQVSPTQVLDVFDRHARLVNAPGASLIRCRDADDQKFVDLAVAQGAEIVSKDKALLALRRKLRVASVFA